MELVLCMKIMASVRWKPAQPAVLRNFRGVGDTSSKSVLVKAKNVRLRNPGHAPIGGGASVGMEQTILVPELGSYGEFQEGIPVCYANVPMNRQQAATLLSVPRRHCWPGC